MNARQQIPINFEPTLPDRWPTLREYVAYLAAQTRKPHKAQAADLDIAPSTLSRKLNPGDGDTQRFNLDDLEGWIASTGEGERVVAYLAAKYAVSNADRHAHLVTNVKVLVDELVRVLPALRGAVA